MAGTNGTMPADILDFVQEAEEAMVRGEMLPGMEGSEEVTIKFGKGLVGEPFTSKKGTTLVEVKIPNADPADKTPWASFVISPKMIHDNKFGKGVWMKLPANDMIRVGKPVLEGQTPEGKNIWKREYRQVTASELKEMVETYKTRDKADQDKEVEEGSEVTIIDTVSYSNLTVGETYHVTGTLMDKETGKAIQKDGKDVTAEAEFTAEKAEGTVDVEFTFNTTDLGGHSVVVFEKMTDVKTGAVIAEHKDLEDKDQTITVKQKPETPEQPKTEKPTTPSNESPKGTTVTSDSPKTGDDSNMILWAVISGGALLAGAGLTGSLIRRRKNEK